MTMSEIAQIGIAHLTHVDLGNHNAGEGGSQLSDLKKVGNQPYISGQAYRHAIKDALKAQTAEGVDCHAAHQCGRISECKLCDLFGYMNPEELDDIDDIPVNRVSPLRATPLVGQYDQPVTTDMILQYDPGIDAESVTDSDHNIGYREMTENVFRGALAIDIPAIGRREIENIEETNNGVRSKRELTNELDDNNNGDDRKDRIEELLTAIQNTSNLAGQARHMADFMPDFLIASTQPVYNQRVSNAIRTDPETGEVDPSTLESVLKDLIALEADVWVAGTRNPSVMNNWDEVMDVVESVDGVETQDSVVATFDTLKDHVKKNL